MDKKVKVQTVVLAGGFGTRLSPLTDIKPKPLVKILDVTVLENILENLVCEGFDNITVSTHYKWEMIRQTCEKYKNVRCKREMEPLGTAGGVKNCYDGESEIVLVVSGDAVFDFNLRSAVEHHLAHKSTVTIVGARKENPTEYGVMLTDENGTVTAFCEKPSWKNVKSDAVNTGIYVLSKYALDRIPDNMQYDFSKNLFPSLMKEGMIISAVFCDGLWCDVGSLDEYYDCNILASKGIIDVRSSAGRDIEKMCNEGIHAQNGVYVSEGAFIGRGVSISGFSVICDKCAVSDECDIDGAIVSENTFVGKGTGLVSCIVGEGVRIGENCIVSKGCVIGDGAVIEDGVVLEEGRVVSALDRIKKEDILNRFKNGGFSFVDDGVAVCSKDNNFADIMSFARAVCLKFKNNEFVKLTALVACQSRDDLYVRSFLAGMDMCSTVFYAGNADKEMMRFASGIIGADFLVRLDCTERMLKVELITGSGGSIDETAEREIMKLYNAVREDENTFKVPTSEICEVPVKELYEAAVIRLVKNVPGHQDFSQIKIYVNCCEEKGRADSFKRIFENFGGKVFAGKSDGVKEVCFNTSGVVLKDGEMCLDENQMRAAVLKRLDELCVDEVYCAKNLPYVMKSLAGKRLKSNVRQRLIQDSICDDGIVVLVMFFALMTVTNENEAQLMEKLPSFGIYTDEYIADVNRGRAMERLSKLYHDSKDDSGEGIKLTLSGGNVTVVPSRAKGFKIIAEAQSVEAAKEIAFKIGRAIKESDI
ncbi:MAG: hypothetical protein E7600_01490 [Ruminococcaceae bacterium]|nr:hypothetical protein [Oscillospiraceae bacterium]